MKDRFNSQYIRGCVRGDPPFCADVCPFHTEIRDFIAKMNRGSFRGAYKILQQAEVFPGIVAEICDARCSGVCPRKGVDQSVKLLELERAAVRLSGSPAPVKYNLPAKTQKVAVIGGGPCGLAFAIRLSAKNYAVTVFEKKDVTGGSFLAAADPELVVREIKLQSKAGSYIAECGREITSLRELEDYDAVFVATGEGGNDFGLAAGGRPDIHAGNRDGFFLGGQLTGCDILESIRDGARAAVDVEKFLKLGTTLFDPEPEQKSRLVPPERMEVMEAVESVSDAGYTAEEAKQEAGRCLRCDCSRCYDACDFMRYYRKYPSQLATAVEFGLRLDVIEPKTNNRMVNACSDCGTCVAVCPYGVDSGREIMLARHQMFEQAQLSDYYHGFLLKDMAHSMSEDAFLGKCSPTGKTEYILFPGCQLTASDPAYTEKAYELLLQSKPDSGILLSCCGAPAFWAGDEALHEKMIEKIRNFWEEAGRPVFVLTCPSCGKQLERFLPEIGWVTLWSLIENVKVCGAGRTFALADPCAAKDDTRWREDITGLLDRMAAAYHPLHENIREAPCCSYGGDVEAANPELKEEIVQSRVTESELPYLCYCTNCRDIYAERGKEAWHILDLLLERQAAPEAPDLTKRRRNRERSAKMVQEKFFGMDGIDVKLPDQHIILRISGEIREEMNRQRLTEDELRSVIAYAERTGLWLEDEDGLRIAHLQMGYITVWAEYAPAKGEFLLKDIYSHRMEIEERGREIKRVKKRYPHYVRS
ncbi:MAG: 4Fe-4S dicluster domain-containing protein [Lachnospiraceae bacterium]|nr:4Fe-4S dicluster domain-containing protein [Lachnospiraceae bacterium]